jgi:hypothetical protein
VSERTAAVKGVASLDALEAVVIERESVAATLEAMELAIDPARVGWARNEGLATLGLWPRSVPVDLPPDGRDLLGIYDPIERTLYLVDAYPLLYSWMFLRVGGNDPREHTLAHEYVHALQHRDHPSLFADPAFWIEHQDAEWALHALVEGDAVPYGIWGGTIGLRPRRPEELRSPRFPRSPAPAIWWMQRVAYFHGHRMLYESRGSLSDPPASSEQVVHARKWREAFLAVDLRALRRRLPAACSFVHENTLGEIGLEALFRELGGGLDPRAWRGWDGDRWLAARCEWRPEFLWLTAWDSEADANEFSSAYASVAGRVAERAGLPGAPSIGRAGRFAWVVTPALSAVAAESPERARVARVSRREELEAHFRAGAAAQAREAETLLRAPRP